MAPKRLSAQPVFFPDRDELEELVAEDEARFLKALTELRQRNFKGQFTELDYALDLKSGGLARIFKGERPLNHRRLLRMIRLSGENPERFFARAFPSRYLQSSPIGLLPRLIERDPRTPPPAWRDRLLAWAEVVEISQDGRSFDFEPEELLRLRKQDLDAAERAGIAFIEYSIELIRGSLAHSSTASMARWLTITATILRGRGERYLAADLFDVALRLEQRICDFACRSFVLRNACYLLSDWGELEEATLFSRQAVELASLSGDLHGLSLSHYAHATMSLYCGDPELALVGYQACLAFLNNTEPEVRVGAAQSMAILHLENDDPGAARIALDEVDVVEVTSISQPAVARLALARGELASQLGDLECAEANLREAVRIFTVSSGTAEIVLAGFFLVRHFLRHHRSGDARREAESLLRVASGSDLDRVSRAILYEAARLCLRGEATAEQITRLAVQWQRGLPNLRKKLSGA